MSREKKRVKKYVARGVRYLDETYPGWDVPYPVEQQRADGCVVAQTTGKLFWTTPESKKSIRWQARRGFNRRGSTVWDQLNKEWNRVIEKRKAAQ